MGYISKEPKLDALSFKDYGVGTPTNPASGNYKLVNRVGNFFVRDSGGTEVSIAGTPTLNSNIRGSEGAGTTTLTNTDKKFQRFNLTAGRNVNLPTTGVVAGDLWTMQNPNPYQLVIRASDSSNIVKSWGSSVTVVALINTPVTNTDWAVVSHEILFGASWTDFTLTYSTGAGITTTYVSKWMRPAIDEVAFYFTNQFSGTPGGGSGNLLVYAPSYFTYSATNYPDGTIAGTCGNNYYLQSGNSYWGLNAPSFTAGNNGFVFYNSYNIADSGGTRLAIFPWNHGNSGDRLGAMINFKPDELAII